MADLSTIRRSTYFRDAFERPRRARKVSFGIWMSSSRATPVRRLALSTSIRLGCWIPRNPPWDIVYSNVGTDRGGSSLSSWLLKPRRLLRNTDLLQYLSAKLAERRCAIDTRYSRGAGILIMNVTPDRRLSELEDLHRNLTQTERDRIWHDNSRSVAEALCTFNRTGTLQNSVTRRRRNVCSALEHTLFFTNGLQFTKSSVL